jgi:hypothetical protein
VGETGWLWTRYFSELRTDTSGFRIGDFRVWTQDDTLIRTHLFWEIRYLVTEDFTGNPRSPTPWALEFLAVEADTGEPPPPSRRPVLTAMMTATTTDAIGDHDPDAELHRRIWQGSSGGQPIVSHAQRSGLSLSGGGILVCDFIPFAEGLPSPDGLWNDYPFWVTLYVGALIENVR